MQKYLSCPHKGLRNRRKINKKQNKTKYYYVRYKEYGLFFYKQYGVIKFYRKYSERLSEVKSRNICTFSFNNKESSLFNRYNQYV